MKPNSANLGCDGLWLVRLQNLIKTKVRFKKKKKKKKNLYFFLQIFLTTFVVKNCWVRF